MLKIIKYEIRKNINGFLVMLFAIALAQAYFMYTYFFKEDTTLIILSSMLLYFVAIICFFIVFGFGVYTYEKDMDSKSSFMFFMTPNSSIKILGGKMLYTLINGVVIAAILVILAIIDVRLVGIKLDEEINLFKEVLDTLNLIGINWIEAVFAIISYAVGFLVVFFMVISLSYFSTTILLTFLSNAKAKKFISVLLFLILFYVITKIGSLFPVLFDEPETMIQSVLRNLPQNLFYLVVMIFNVFACSYMLDRKVNL